MYNDLTDSITVRVSQHFFKIKSSSYYSSKVAKIILAKTCATLNLATFSANSLTAETAQQKSGSKLAADCELRAPAVLPLRSKHHQPRLATVSATAFTGFHLAPSGGGGGGGLF